jgi:hypothetical protein
MSMFNYSDNTFYLRSVVLPSFEHLSDSCRSLLRHLSMCADHYGDLIRVTLGPHFSLIVLLINFASFRFPYDSWFVELVEIIDILYLANLLWSGHEDEPVDI